MLDYLRRLYTQLRWADLRVLERLRSAPDERAVHLLAHVLAAERVWLTRLRGEDSRHLDVWPSHDIDGCADAAGAVHRDFARYLDELPEALLPEAMEYTNQVGAHYRARRIDVLTHVATHGHYHRGQIAQTLRLAGHEPVSTDFIVWVREEG